jgi:RND family efflux transporter MFP subunit
MKRLSGLLLLSAVVVSGCGRGSHESGSAAPGGPPRDVQSAVASTTDLPRQFETGGVVKARTTATLTSRIVAEVEEVRVRPGDRVRAGQVLIRLDARELRANRARAEASAAAAEQAVKAAVTARESAEAARVLASATHQRIAELRAKNSATPHEYDQAVSALRGAEAQAQGAQAGIEQAQAGAVAARAAVDGARVGESYASITAPFDGVVTEKLVEPGNTASPGLPLMTIEDVRAFRLEVRVDEARVGEIEASRPVAVVLESPIGSPASSAPAALTGRIAEIARALDPDAHAFLVKIDLPAQQGLRSGMFGRARFAGPGRRALAVPERALVRNGQLTSVFVVGSDGRAHLRLVNPGLPASGLVEIAAGLDEGERVVVSPPPGLVDGAPVREARR